MRFDAEGRAAINDRARIARQPSELRPSYDEPGTTYNQGGGNIVNSPKQRLNLQIHRDRVRERGPVKPAPLP